MEDFYLDGPSKINFYEKSNMMPTYRKLNLEELKQYGISVGGLEAGRLKKIYGDYFNGEIKPIKALLVVNSEYNDEGYENQVRRIVFYDKNDNELLPVKSKSRAFYTLNFDMLENSEEPIEDKIVFLETPDLYVLEE